jgi:hypothetical protein
MFAAVALAAAIVLFVKFPAFRKITVAVAAAGALGIILLFGYSKQQEANSARKSEAAKHLVAPTSLEFEDMRLGNQYGDYRLTGRVKNMSQYTVTSIAVKLSISDCDSNGHCDVVGDKEEECYLRIPPGQARDIDETLFMEHGTVIRNTMQWDYRIQYVSAEQ